ncbi:hypothetical protein ACFX5K_05230 [Rickettsiales bacterium LUAb2]
MQDKPVLTKYVSFSLVNNNQTDVSLQLNNLSNDNYWDNSTNTLHVAVDGEHNISAVADNISVNGTLSEQEINVSYTNENSEILHFSSLTLNSDNIDGLTNLPQNFTDINYSSFPELNNHNNDYSNVDNNSLNVVSNDVSPINSHEEVTDYSFLNVITEEIVPLNSINDLSNLKTILHESLHDTANNNPAVIHGEIDQLVQNFTGSNDYKMYLHNIEDVSYLEIVNHNDHVYNVAIHNGGISNIDNSSIDSILNSMTEYNQNNKT